MTRRNPKTRRDSRLSVHNESRLRAIDARIGREADAKKAREATMTPDVPLEVTVDPDPDGKDFSLFKEPHHPPLD